MVATGSIPGRAIKADRDLGYGDVSTTIVSRFGRFVTIAIIASSGAAVAQTPAHEGANTPALEGGPEPDHRSTFPDTVAPPSAAGPSANVSFDISAYGILISSMSWNLGNTSNNPDVPEWAVEGDDAFFFSARASRIGIRASWNEPPGDFGIDNVFGIVEADFNGGFVGQGNFFAPLPRLRLASATAEWSSIRLSVGQDWSVLAPLNPNSAFHTGIPGFTTSGNLWARLPQLRVDGAVGFGSSPDDLHLVWAAALIASSQTDAIPTDESDVATVRIPQGGERSLAPGGEARLAIATKLFGKSFELGVSGHIGNRDIEFTGGDDHQWNGAIAADLTLPLPAKFKFKGEAFWGKGLDAYFGGINQGIAHTTNAAGDITSIGDSISTFGAWGQASWAGVEWLTLYGGAGFDDPDDDDLLAINAATNRTLNVAVYGEVALELAHGLALWFEYDYMRTDFEAPPNVTTHVVSLTGALTF